jgi:importin subunit beta-1
LTCQYYDYLNLYFDRVCAVIGLAMQPETPEKVHA